MAESKERKVACTSDRRFSPEALVPAAVDDERFASGIVCGEAAYSMVAGGLRCRRQGDLTESRRRPPGDFIKPDRGPVPPENGGVLLETLIQRTLTANVASACDVLSGRVPESTLRWTAVAEPHPLRRA
jgi:hypothetical protein